MLGRVLDVFERLRGEHGMWSRSMHELAKRTAVAQAPRAA
jgi:hypothetical protein